MYSRLYRKLFYSLQVLKLLEIFKGIIFDVFYSTAWQNPSGDKNANNLLVFNRFVNVFNGRAPLAVTGNDNNFIEMYTDYS